MVVRKVVKTRKKVNKIEKFIIDNKLDFTSLGSDLNSNCTILAGYACYLELDWTDLQEAINSCEKDIKGTSWWNFDDELKRVFTYANDNMYGMYWKSDEAKKTYIF